MAHGEQRAAQHPLQIVARLRHHDRLLVGLQPLQQGVQIREAQQRDGQADQGQQRQRRHQGGARALVVAAALQDGDAGGRAHAQHGAQAHLHHHQRIGQRDGRQAVAADEVADEDAVDDHVKAGGQHAGEGGNGVLPEQFGHRQRVQVAVVCCCV